METLRPPMKNEKPDHKTTVSLERCRKTETPIKKARINASTKWEHYAHQQKKHAEIVNIGASNMFLAGVLVHSGRFRREVSQKILRSRGARKRSGWRQPKWLRASVRRFVETALQHLSTETSKNPTKTHLCHSGRRFSKFCSRGVAKRLATLLPSSARAKHCPQFCFLP